MELTVEGITADEYPMYRSIVMPHLESIAGRSHGRRPVWFLEDEIMRRELQLWKIGDWQAVCLTSVSDEAVHVQACTGVRRLEWQDELDKTMKQWARRLGKKYVIATVRPGWTKACRERGYKEAHREMVYKI